MNDERDEYSGLHKRDYGLAQLEIAIAQAKQHDHIVGLLLTDFDNYKSWNDKHGHSLGDVMLRQLANVAEQVISDKGITCRIGGDEFLIVLPNTSPVEARELAQQLCVQVAEQKITVKGCMVPSVTITIGLAFYPEHGEDTLSLLRAADEAGMQGKQLGKNRVSLP